MNLPPDFGEKAHKVAANCPYVLTDHATGTPLVAGDVVLAQDLPGIESAFGKGRTVRAMLFGFTKPHGFACLLDCHGEWWVVHPEACRHWVDGSGVGLGRCASCGYMFVREDEKVRQDPPLCQGCHR